MHISQVSKKFDIPPDTLRYYEKIGLLPPVKKENNIRQYSEVDIKWIEFIKCMRQAGFPIKDLVQYVSLFYEGSHTKDQRKEILINQKIILEEKMKNMQGTIAMLDYKIKHYDEIVSAETILHTS